jgi:excisionase family DNA binding protein
MPRVYRQQYTRPIPEGAERVTLTVKKEGQEVKVPAVRFKGGDGKTVTAPIVQKGKTAGTHFRVASPTWYGRVNGVPVPLCPNKAASEVMLAEKIKEACQGAAGMRDPFKNAKERPLAEHLADFAAHLRAKGDTERHVGQVAACCEALFEGAGFARPADLELSRATAWLTSLRAGKPVAELPAEKQEWTPGEAAKLLGVVRRVVSAAVARHGLPTNGKDGKARRLPRATVQALLDRAARGAAPETVNHYVAAVRSFCRWMVKPARRLPFNPLDGLAMLNVRTDRRHDRRELAAEEIRRLLAAARSSGRSWRGLDGNARYHLYAMACGTGFRAGALASLTPECFDLSGDRPTVTLAARFNKSRKTKVQPLPPDVAGLLRAYLDGKLAGQPVWPGAWASEKGGAAMIRIDLEAAGIPYVVDGPEGPCTPTSTRCATAT